MKFIKRVPLFYTNPSLLPFASSLFIFIIESNQMSQQSFDLVVVGTGVFGLSTAVFLCTHYPLIKFALLEQFKIGHGEGSSHSEIRIIRSTYRK